MKKTIIAATCIAALMAISCAKESTAGLKDDSPREIVLGMDTGELDFNVTKASEITSLPSSLYWSGTTGTAGTSETSKVGSASATLSSSKIATGIYQTKTPTAYNWYVANSAITFATAGSTVTVDGTSLDAIAGVAKANSTTAPSVTLKHIFARIGTLTCNTQSGYTISNISWKIKGNENKAGTKGTYNIANETWGSTATTQLTSETAISANWDTYLIPGSYKCFVTYTLTKGDYTDTFTKSGNVTLDGGKKNNLSCTAIGGSAQEIQISCTLTGWGSVDKTITLE